MKSNIKKITGWHNYMKSGYIELSVGVFDLIDYTWFLHHGWLKDSWRVATSEELKYHNDCKRFFEGIQLTETENYYFYPSLNCNVIIINDNGKDILINKMFPRKYYFDNNPYIDQKIDCYGMAIYKDRFKLLLNPYI